ncbi:hypothetical protein MPSI1_000037 [Malassezia psittaci]|uniref:NADH dehydrogenase [ubiquinone] iron-sulfur protein 5 n=1 Tax=Malassezia psittaci TaxID=1821823 RepID=A0AAF0F239_9BASI|nr:hypothetical protein MPSI1_000037 [Malassezia psittaci]
MASGFGFNGGPSRCFSFWQDFRKCYVTAESAGDCMPQKDDYLECLHHTKEVRVSSLKQLARAHTIQEHTIKRQAEESRRAREEAKKGGVAGPRLGLIQIDSDDAQGDSADNAKSS